MRPYRSNSSVGARILNEAHPYERTRKSCGYSRECNEFISYSGNETYPVGLLQNIDFELVVDEQMLGHGGALAVSMKYVLTNSPNNIKRGGDIKHSNFNGFAVAGTMAKCSGSVFVLCYGLACSCTFFAVRCSLNCGTGYIPKKWKRIRRLLHTFLAHI